MIGVWAAMDSKWEERRSVIKFLLLEDGKSCHIFQRMQKSFFLKPACPSMANVVPPFVQPRPCPLQLFFVSRTEKRLAGNKYETSAALISAVNRYLSSRSSSWIAEAIQMLPQREQKCSDIGGECCENK